MILYKNIDEVLTLQGASLKGGRRVQEEDLSIVKNASILVDQGKIVWIGEHKKLPQKISKKLDVKEFSLKGKTVLPGFIECHTHLIFGGNRADEFEQRLNGVSYQEIAARGGGILSTMTKTRKLSAQDLYEDAQIKVENFVKQGVTTLEIKSGYALDEKNEIKVLEVANQSYPIDIVPTFLGAHSIPPEFKSEPEKYLQYLVKKVLPKVKHLTSRVDIFIENGFFDQKMARVYLQQAKQMGFDIVIHADQLSLCGGADLAVELEAKSADHLIQVKSKQVRNLAKSKVTCVLLPAADLYMKCAYPPARQLIDEGARVALATDYNPGSSPTQDLALVGLLARLEMKMTLPEVISAYTVGASYALGFEKIKGSIEVGKNAEFIISDKAWTEFFYSVGNQPVESVVV